MLIINISKVHINSCMTNHIFTVNNAFYAYVFSIQIETKCLRSYQTEFIFIFESKTH